MSDKSPFPALNPIDLGRMIRKEREFKGLTQAQVAEKAMVRRQAVAAVETGKNVSVRTLLGVLSALNKGVRLADKRYPQMEEIRELFKEYFEDDD